MARLRTLLVVGIVLATMLAGDPVAAAPPGEVVGGQPADPGEYPYQVGLLRHNEPNRFQAQFCGGSLISRDTVLTAAHCVEDLRAPQLDILAGTHLLSGTAGRRVQARRIRIHPQYDPDTSVADLAIVQLPQNLPLGPTIEPVAAAVPADAGLWPPGTEATATGWGDTNPGPGTSFPTRLHEVEVPVVSDGDCAVSYGPDFHPNEMLCAGEPGQDTCQGDSGGPLVVPDGGDWLQIGITSFGLGCGVPGFPGVYTEVDHFTSFIGPYLDPDGVPEAVRQPRAQRLGPHSFRISWRPPFFDGGSRITMYQVAVPSLGRVHGVPPDQLFKRLRNLPDGRRTITIRARNAQGFGPAASLLVNV
jgi:secreted trypsin-like serine protease